LPEEDEEDENMPVFMKITIIKERIKEYTKKALRAIGWVILGILVIISIIFGYIELFESLSA
jgi:hypothetical protein